MFAYIPVPLRQPAQTTNEHIREIFKELGFSISLDEYRTDFVKNEVTIGSGLDQKIVKIDSNQHHRYLGLRNLSDSAPTAILKEVELYGVFTGASASFQGKLYVTRATGGALGIWCYQSKLDRLLLFCEKIGRNLQIGPLGKIVHQNELKSSAENFTLYSDTMQIICYGDLQFSRFRSLLEERYTDIAILMITIFIFLASFLLHFVAVEHQVIGGHEKNIDPLGPTLRAFAENTWPASATAVITILLSLFVAFAVAPSQKIAWAWKK